MDPMVWGRSWNTESCGLDINVCGHTPPRRVPAPRVAGSTPAASMFGILRARSRSPGSTVDEVPRSPGRRDGTGPRPRRDRRRSRPPGPRRGRPGEPGGRGTSTVDLDDEGRSRDVEDVPRSTGRSRSRDGRGRSRDGRRRGPSTSTSSQVDEDLDDEDEDGRPRRSRRLGTGRRDRPQLCVELGREGRAPPSRRP
jgi:hypothetical protein